MPEGQIPQRLSGLFEHHAPFDEFQNFWDLEPDYDQDFLDCEDVSDLNPEKGDCE